MAGVLSTSRKITSLSSFCYTTKVNLNGVISLQVATIRLKSGAAKQEDADYQYIIRSSVPTMHFQDSMPRLPIPKLEDTCRRYLRAQKPLLSEEGFKNTKQSVTEFLRREGMFCQQALEEEDKNNKHTSYICKPWFDTYLSDRRPLPINYNPFLVFVDCPEEYNNQLMRACNLVISSLRFYKSLTEGLLEPEVYHMNPKKSNTKFFRQVTGLLPRSISWYGAYLFKAFPLDMSQYENLFNTTRVPEPGKDRVKHVPGKRHIVVMRRGHFYVFDVLDKDGQILEPGSILSNIQSILRSGEEDDDDDDRSKFPLGVLTTENRDIWASARKHLENTGNAEALEAIDSGLFVLSLDHETETKNAEDSGLRGNYINQVRTFLHADGINRWFDKSFSLIVGEDGTAGVNFEHSWGDGVAVLRYFNDIHQDSIKKPWVHPTTVGTSAPKVTKLEFKLDDKMKSLITEAKKKHDKTCSSLQIWTLDYRLFGRDLCKPLKISPDAMMQLSFQLAYNQLTGKQVATYESCSTAAFKHGRTETVRPCTQETLKVCKALDQPIPPSKTELQQMIVACSKYHSQLIKEAAMGLGFDRHLFALRLKADGMNMKPAIFSDPAYPAINHNILSTSTLSSDNIQTGAFGPVVPDGLGIAYSIWNDRLGSIVTNYKGQSDGKGFVQALSESFDKIHSVLKN